MNQEKKVSALRVACVQMEPRVGHKADNMARGLQLITEAAAAGARLVVLPELCNSGYVFETREEALEAGEPVPDGPSCKAWMNAAAENDVMIVAGIAERVGDVLYNSAAIVGPDGCLGTYRKNHLWGIEKQFFESGDLGVPVFEIEGGRFACAICYDMWFSEIYRMAAISGADLLCVPTNWGPRCATNPRTFRSCPTCWRWAAHTQMRSSLRPPIASALNVVSHSLVTA